MEAETESGKILIVDDDPMTCRLLETIFKMEGFNAISITVAGRVIPILEEETPSLVIIDYHLAGEEGVELIRPIRENRTTANTPVIMTSAIDRTKESLEAGAEGFIIKPFDMDKIVEQVRVLIEKGR